MEMEFEQKLIRFLCRTAWGEKTVEETAEIKLPAQEVQPEQILGTWGQVCLTEKHWSDGAVAVSGGVNAWVLLQTDEGVQCIAGWVPFRQGWELHETQRDGKVIIRAGLKGVDARMTGAGKLIITAQVSLFLQALEPCAVNRYEAPQLPEDIYLQKKTVAVNVPMEAGEKRMSVEEAVSAAGPVAEVLYHRTEPVTEECRVMGDKLVFRGAVEVHALCRGENGGLMSVRETVPVSQYIQLDGEYGSAALADVIPAVLSSEAEKDENGNVVFRADVLWQYVLHDALEVDAVTDAYSNRRAVETDLTQLCIPTLRAWDEVKQETACAFTAENSGVVDQCVLAGCADWDERTGKLRQEGAVRMLYLDGEGKAQSAVLPFETETALDQDGDGYAVVAWQKPSEVLCESKGEIQVRTGYGMYFMEDRCVPCCKALAAADEAERKEQRPCLILRRAGTEELWQLAKASGSSETAIRIANGFEGEPEKGRMLLIPVE